MKFRYPITASYVSDWKLPHAVREVIAGIEDRGVFPQIDVILSGYQGGEGIADVILDAVTRVKAANPSAVYACDPVMGNAKSGCFVAPAIPVLLRERVVPAADIITPNQFELAYLADMAIVDVESAVAAARRVRAQGPRIVVCTSLTAGVAEGELAVLADTADGSWLVRTPHHTILIDACIGNGKARSLPHFNMRNEPWLERLAATEAV